MVFLHFLRAVKLFLIKICKDVSCIPPIVTALKKELHSKSSSPSCHCGVLFGLSCGIFLYFLRVVWLLKKFWTYILDNTLMDVRLKHFMGGISLSLGIFWAFFWGGGGRRGCRGYIFSIFMYFLRKVWYVFNVFIKFCQDIPVIALAITQEITWHVTFIFHSYFKLF